MSHLATWNSQRGQRRMGEFFVFCLRMLRRIGGYLIGLVGFVIFAGGLYVKAWLEAGLGALILVLAIWMQRHDD